MSRLVLALAATFALFAEAAVAQTHTPLQNAPSSDTPADVFESPTQAEAPMKMRRRHRSRPAAPAPQRPASSDSATPAQRPAPPPAG